MQPQVEKQSILMILNVKSGLVTIGVLSQGFLALSDFISEHTGESLMM